MRAPPEDVSTLGIASGALPLPESKVGLMIGPYRAGKTLTVIERVLSLHRQNPFSESIVVVPSQRYKTLFEQRLLEAMGKGGQVTLDHLPSIPSPSGLVGLHIINFYDLCQKLLRKCGMRFRVLPEEIRSQVLARVIKRLLEQGKLKTLAEESTFKGTQQNILSLIDEFERAALVPADVLSKLSQSVQLDSRYFDLATIYQHYWQELEEIGLVDQRQVGFKLLAALNANDAAVLGIGDVIVDGFDRFNKLQLKVFSALSRFAQSLTICFDFASDENGHAHEDYLWKESSYQELLALFAGRSRIVSFVLPLERSLTRTGYTLPKFSCTDRFLEMEEVARRVKCLLVREKAKPEEILVVVRSLRNYGAAVANAFEDAGIPCFLDQALEIKKLPLVQFLLNLFRLSAQEFPRWLLINCLRSPYLNKEFSQLSLADLEKIERESFKQCVVSGKSHWADLFVRESNPSDQNAEYQENGQRMRDKVLAVIERITPPEVNTLSQFVGWCEDLLEELLAMQYSGEHGDAQQKWIEERALLELRRCFSYLLIEETFLGDRIVDYSSFLRRLEILIDKSNFRATPAAKNSVTVCSADLAPNRSYDHVFLAGLVEGEFPRKTLHSGFVGSDEIRRWYSFGVNIINPRFHPGFESALFSNLVGRAKNGVQLSFPLNEFSGEELTPSFFLTQGQEDSGIQTMAIFREAKLLPVSPRNLAAGILAADEVPMVESAGEMTTPGLEKWQMLSTYENKQVSHLCLRMQERVLLANGRLSPNRRSLFNGYLVDQVTCGALRVPLPDHWSATKLSDYGKCGFKFWVSHVLRAQPAREPHLGLEPILVGQVYHKALELLYKELKSAGIALGTGSAEQIWEIFERAVEDSLLWLVQSTKLRLSEFWQLEKQEIKFRLRRFLSKEIARALKDKYGFEPESFEVTFGFNEDEDSYPALTIADGPRQIAIAGRIDRLDLLKGHTDSFRPRVKVVDYKSGSNAIAREESYSGRNLQLALYALAVERAILPGSEVVQAAFLSIGSGEITGNLNLGSWEAQKAEAIERPKLLTLTEEYVKEYVERITAGDFSVEPNGKQVCQNCPHKTICRIAEVDSAIELELTR